MKKYCVIEGKKGQKQVRFWSHPKISPVNMTDIRQAIDTEFQGIDDRELWLVSGFMNFWIERKADGTVDTES